MKIETKEQYEAALAAHDWYGEYSDDYRVWKEWKDAMVELIAASANFDRDFVIWNKHAPQGHQF